MEVRTLPAPTDGLGRIESGPLQVGDDWPGTFIRGDNCMGYVATLNMVIYWAEAGKVPDAMTVEQVRGLISELAGCIK